LAWTTSLTLTGGRYEDTNIKRDAAASFGLNIADVQSVVSSAIDGENIGSGAGRLRSVRRLQLTVVH
jgi:Cu/Ag efflux pump CusA